MSDQRLILIDGSVENRTQLGRGGRVHIVRIGEGASADEQSSGHIWFDPTSRSPIKDLIEAAEMSEWTALLKTSQFERALDKAVEGKQPKFSVDELQCEHPRAFSQASDEPIKDAAENIIALNAREISARATLFCLCKLPNQKNGEQVQRARFFDAMAEELAQPQSMLVGSGISFIRLKDDRALADDYENLMTGFQAKLTSTKQDDRGGRDGPVLLIGETGSGKTELAHALHKQLCLREKRKGEFIAVNVAAINTSLLESRLHGHMKGAFTDAKQEHEGWFEQADDGTLFLDEFQSAPNEIQLQLLDLMRATSDIVRISRMGGESKKRSLRVRLILATNESVADLRKKGQLRTDLFYRIRHCIEIPSLNKRLNEGLNEEPQLLQRLLCLHRWRSNAPLMSDDSDGSGVPQERDWRLAMVPAFDSQTLALLRDHKWPGNMREFEKACFDVYWEYDRISGEINWTDAFSRSLDIEHESAGADPGLDQSVLIRLRAAERILVKNGFNVSRSQKELAGIKLKSPMALKAFLRKLSRHLVSNHWQDSRARALLGNESAT